jgi:hypothetical protein
LNNKAQRVCEIPFYHYKNQSGIRKVKVMELLNIFAGIGIVVGDLLAILSVIGSVILFVGALVSNSPMRKFGQIANWSVMGLVFGVIFQFSMAITGTTPELIGAVVRMKPIMVNGLLTLSFVLLVGRWWLRRNRLKFAVHVGQGL